MTNLLICMEIWSQILENGESVDVIQTSQRHLTVYPIRDCYRR